MLLCIHFYFLRIWELHYSITPYCTAFKRGRQSGVATHLKLCQTQWTHALLPVVMIPQPMV